MVLPDYRPAGARIVVRRDPGVRSGQPALGSLLPPAYIDKKPVQQAEKRTGCDFTVVSTKPLLAVQVFNFRLKPWDYV